MANEEYSQIKDLITESEFQLLRNSEWIEILFKFYDFYALNSQMYLKLLRRVIKFLHFILYCFAFGVFKFIIS